MKFPPTELLGRLPPMAICAPNVALFQFLLDQVQPGSPQQITDVERLLPRFPVVELQNQRINLPTVNAGVILHEFHNETPVTVSIASAPNKP